MDGEGVLRLDGVPRAWLAKVIVHNPSGYRINR